MAVGLVLQADNQGTHSRVNELDTVYDSDLDRDGLGGFADGVALWSRHLGHNVVSGSDGADNRLTLGVGGVGANEIAVSRLNLEDSSGDALLVAGVTFENN